MKDIQLRCVHHFIFFIRLLIHLFIYLFMYACSILKFLFLDFRPFVSIYPIFMVDRQNYIVKCRKVDRDVLKMMLCASVGNETNKSAVF